MPAPVPSAARVPKPSTVSAFVNDEAPLSPPPNEPVWVAPLMLNWPYDALSPNGLFVPPTMSPEEMVIVVVLVTNAGTVFHVTVMVPVAADGPRRLVKLLDGAFNVPLIEPVMLVMFGSFVEQPSRAPLTVITSGPLSTAVSVGLKPTTPLMIVSHVTV